MTHVFKKSLMMAALVTAFAITSCGTLLAQHARWPATSGPVRGVFLLDICEQSHGSWFGSLLVKLNHFSLGSSVLEESSSFNFVSSYMKVVFYE